MTDKAETVSEPKEKIERVSFAEIYSKAYGWTVTDDGYLAGLVAGDMGYEITDKKLEDLFVDAQVAEEKSARETKGPWPFHEAVMTLVQTAVEVLYPDVKKSEKE